MDEVGPVEAWRELGPSTMRRLKVVVPSLWMQAVTEAGEDPEIRRFVRRHMREVHDFFAEALRRLQDAGGIPPDRDPDAEAWVFLGGSLLASFAERLGGYSATTTSPRSRPSAGAGSRAPHSALCEGRRCLGHFAGRS